MSSQSSSRSGKRTPSGSLPVVSFTLTCDPEKHKREENPTILPNSQTTWKPYVRDTFLDRSATEIAKELLEQDTETFTKEGVHRHLRDYYDYFSSVKQYLDAVDENKLHSELCDFRGFLINTIQYALDKRFVDRVQHSKDSAYLDEISARQKTLLNAPSSSSEMTSLPGFRSTPQQPDDPTPIPQIQPFRMTVMLPDKQT